MNAKQLLNYLQHLDESKIDLEAIDLNDYMKRKHLARLNAALGRYLLYCGAKNQYLTDTNYMFDFTDKLEDAARFMSIQEAIVCIPGRARDAEWEWQIALLLPDNSTTFLQEANFNEYER